MADMITRCPNCSTAFRISEDMITSAKGVVRCGSCLNVFNAKEYLVNTPKSKPNISEGLAPKPMSQVISDLQEMSETTQSIHQSAAVHAASPPPRKTRLNPRQTISSGQDQLKKPASQNTPLFERPKEAVASEEDENSIDEAWALELLKEDAESENQEIQIRKVVEQNKQEEPAESVRNTDTGSSKGQSHQENTENLNSAKKDKQHTKSSDGDEANKRLPNAETYSASSEKEPATLIDSIEIQPETLDSILAERNTSIFKRVFWPVLTLLMILAFIGQILWLQFYRLNQVSPYRTIYAAACWALDCELPELKDHSLIQASNLLIRSHPDEKDALLVDVILKNQAAFEQRFPNLRLTFTDIRNKPVATRRIRPAEYLGGELTGLNIMPRDQGIHIGLEIVDPGPKAVSYTIKIEGS